MSRRQRKSKRKTRRGSETDWPAVLAESALLAVVFLVPVVINKASSNICDVKDVVLGVGVALGLSVWLTASLARGRLEWVSSRLTVVITGFAVWAGITIIYSGYRYATVSEFGRLAAHVGLYLLAIVSLRSITQARRVIGFACLAAVPACIYGFVQAAGRDPLVWDAAPGRVFSLLGNATYLAGFLVLVVPLAVAVGWPRSRGGEKEPTRRRRFWARARPCLFLGAAGMMVVCLFFTVTFSPTIGLGLGAVVAAALALLRGGRALLRAVAPWVAMALLAVAGLGALAYRQLPERQQRRAAEVLRFKDPYGGLRRVQWGIAFDLFKERPLLGGGYGTFRVYSLERFSPIWYTKLGRSAEKMLIPNHAHNEYLQVLAGTGVIGGALFYLLLGAAGATALRVSLRHPRAEWRRIALGVTVAATAFLLQNFFGMTFRQTGAVTFFWLWLALLALAAAWMPAAGKEAVAPSLRQVRFAPLSAPLLLLVASGLACAVMVLGWYAVRPVLGNLKGVQAKNQARMAESLPADQKAAKEHLQAAARLAEEAVRLSPYSPNAHYTAAYVWGQLGDYDKALEANKRALQLLPGNASFEYNLGVTYLRKGEHQKAETSLRRALELMPTSAEHNGALADLLLQQNRTEEAVPFAQQALRLAPGDPKAHMLMADVEARRGNREQAASHLQQALRRAPEDVRIAQQLCEMLLALGKDRPAVDACRDWVRLDPRSARGWQGLGVAHFKLGDYRASEKAFARAAELDPESAKARLRLGHSLLRLRRSAEAAREFEEALRLDPEGKDGKEAAAMLARMGLPAGAAPR